MSETLKIIEWPRRTFSYGPVTITVERQTVGHQVVTGAVLSALPDFASETDRLYSVLFARIVAQTKETDGLDVDFPKLGAPDQEWLQAFEIFKRMDAQLVSLWVDALNEVDRPPNAHELWPSHMLSEGERKNLGSAGLNGRMTSGATSRTTTRKKG